MITNKDIRVENGNLVLNGDKFPLDGQSPEAIMQIVEDNSDTTPTENSTAPVTSGGVYTADKAISDTIGDLTQTGVTGASVAAQIGALKSDIGNVVKTTAPLHNVTLNFSNGTAEVSASDMGASMILNALAWGAGASLSIGLFNWTQGKYYVFNNSNPTFTGTMDVMFVYVQ